MKIRNFLPCFFLLQSLFLSVAAAMPGFSIPVSWHNPLPLPRLSPNRPNNSNNFDHFHSNHLSLSPLALPNPLSPHNWVSMDTIQPTIILYNRQTGEMQHMAFQEEDFRGFLVSILKRNAPGHTSLAFVGFSHAEDAWFIQVLKDLGFNNIQFLPAPSSTPSSFGAYLHEGRLRIEQVSQHNWVSIDIIQPTIILYNAQTGKIKRITVRESGDFILYNPKRGEIEHVTLYREGLLNSISENAPEHNNVPEHNAPEHTSLALIGLHNSEEFTQVLRGRRYSDIQVFPIISATAMSIGAYFYEGRLRFGLVKTASFSNGLSLVPLAMEAPSGESSSGSQSLLVAREISRSSTIDVQEQEMPSSFSWSKAFHLPRNPDSNAENAFAHFNSLSLPPLGSSNPLSSDNWVSIDIIQPTIILYNAQTGEMQRMTFHEWHWEKLLDLIFKHVPTHVPKYTSLALIGLDKYSEAFSKRLEVRGYSDIYVLPTINISTTIPRIGAYFYKGCLRFGQGKTVSFSDTISLEPIARKAHSGESSSASSQSLLVARGSTRSPSAMKVQKKEEPPFLHVRLLPRSLFLAHVLGRPYFRLFPGFEISLESSGTQEIITYLGRGNGLVLIGRNTNTGQFYMANIPLKNPANQENDPDLFSAMVSNALEELKKIFDGDPQSFHLFVVFFEAKKAVTFADSNPGSSLPPYLSDVADLLEQYFSSQSLIEFFKANREEIWGDKSVITFNPNTGLVGALDPIAFFSFEMRRQ